MHTIKITAKNFYEAGVFLGRSQKGLLKKHWYFSRNITKKMFHIKWNYLLKYIKPLIPITEKKTPYSWQYLLGISHGSHLDFHELFTLNSYDLPDNGHLRTQTPYKKMKNCTCVMYRSRASEFLGFTEEWNRQFLPFLTLITIQIKKISFSALTFPAEIPGYSAGVNSFGLGYGCNSLRLKNDGFGIPLPFALFYLNISKTSKEFLAWYKNIRVGSSININTLDTQEISFAECRNDGKQHTVKKKEGYLIHTNHPVSESIFSNTQRTEKNELCRSIGRYKRVSEILQSKKITRAKDVQRYILSDTEGRWKILNTNVLAETVYDGKTKKFTIFPQGGKKVLISFKK